ncbi:unnamed protein product [Ixodes persulcatus]
MEFSRSMFKKRETKCFLNFQALPQFFFLPVFFFTFLCVRTIECNAWLPRVFYLYAHTPDKLRCNKFMSHF